MLAELVIPTYNRLEILKNTVSRVRSLYPDLPICLGIQGEMPSGMFAGRLRNDGKIRIEALPGPGTARALNQCIRTSAADIVLILDDDAVPHFGWLEAHQSAFAAAPGLAYTSGREVRAARGRSGLSEWARILTESIYGLFLKKDTKINGRIVSWMSRSGFLFGNFDQPGNCIINAPRGCNMAVRKSLFLGSGGFNERFRGNAWGFEAEFGVRMARQGRYGQYRGDALVVHYEVSSGGSRSAARKDWFADFLFNHSVLIGTLGPQAWLGSIPRLLKKRFFA